MHRKLTPLISLAIICIGILGIAFNVPKVKANETIYIQADGTINPPPAPIQQNGNIYTLTDNITTDTDEIIIEKDNITLNGIGHTLQGTENGKGINLSYKHNITIQNINIKQFSIGINLYKSSNNTITGITITNSSDAIKIRNSPNITITNNTITASKSDGIYISTSNLNTISKNNIKTSDQQCIAITSSSNITISENNITNSHDGIYLHESSNILITKNNITENTWKAIWLDSSSQNTITENNMENNGYGIKLYQSSNNFIYHNSFSNNTLQVHDTSWICHACTPSINTWDNNYSSSGNYWSDYTKKYPNATEIDNSGIWNTPYEIDTNNADRYPLVVSEFPSLIIPFFMIATLPVVMICRKKYTKTTHMHSSMFNRCNPLTELAHEK